MVVLLACYARLPCSFCASDLMTDIRTNIDQYVPDDDARADADAAEGLSVARRARPPCHA